MELNTITSSEDSVLYRVAEEGGSLIKEYVVSTPETRAICNDPLVFGFEYTEALKAASAKALGLLRAEGEWSPAESESTVFHILRGGLNFGLREALAEAYQWNKHNCAYVSAQRARVEAGSSDWHITESNYQKVYLRPRNSIIFGDVVATGTSLEYGIRSLLEAAKAQSRPLNDITFFTIGGPKSAQIFEQLLPEIKEASPACSRINVVYFEGIFKVAETSSPLAIKIDGTDLLRRDCVMAPEFIQSQTENPAFPLERCTIYDAGSRSFHVEEYLEDVIEYWEQVSELAVNKKVSYREYLSERAPCVDGSEFQPSLAELCQEQLSKLRAALE